MSFPRASFALAASALLLAACPDNAKLPIGSSCSSDGSCASGYCIASLCLDPNADDDGDGLINSIEGALGTNPMSADTDGDGVSDYDEVVNANSPQDTDGDGKSDAVESLVADADQDCIVDQLDAHDDQPETDPVVLAGFVCVHDGACGAAGAVVSATCTLEGDKRVHHCDYSQVPGYEATEAACDEVDNDCNGVTDEPFTAGGTVTYTDDDGTIGKVKGSPCGIGACSGGVVVCRDASTLTCSTQGSGTAEVCDSVDNDCDGSTDEPFAAGGSVTFDGGGYAPDAGKVLGDACGTGACAGGQVACDAADTDALACSTASNASAEACGDSVDNDCEGTTDQGFDLVSCTTFFYDGDHDNYGLTADSQCTCVSAGAYTATAGGDCDDLDDTRSPGAAPICGVDADCDDHLLDVGEGCDDGDDELFGDGCAACEITETALTQSNQRNRYNVVAAGFLNGGFGACWREDYGFAVTFAGLATTGVACGFYGADGAELGAFAMEDNATLYRSSPQMAVLADGDVIVAWLETSPQQSAYALQAARFGADGTAKSEPFRLDDVDVIHSDFVVAPLDGGAFAIAWLTEDYLSNTYEPRVRAFDATNAPRFASVVAGAAGYLSEIHLVGFDDGSLLAGWLEQDLELYKNRIVLQRFASTGAKVGEPLAGVADGGPNDVRPWALLGYPGGAFTTFYSYDTSDYSYAVAMQAFASDGSADGAEVYVIAPDITEQPDRYRAAALLDGTVGLAYESYEADLPATIWILPVASAPVTIVLETTDFEHASGPASVAATPTGPFVVVWPGTPPNSNGTDVFYQRVNADGSKRYH